MSFFKRISDDTSLKTVLALAKEKEASVFIDSKTHDTIISTEFMTGYPTIMLYSKIYKRFIFWGAITEETE